MSKFFKGGGSDSSESSESEDEYLKPAQLGGISAARGPLAGRGGGRTFRYSSESSEEDRPRIVRSAKEKRYGELKDLIRKIRNAKMIRDMTKVLEVFEELGKSFAKARTVMEREGTPIPRFYIRYLAELEAYVNDAWKDSEAKKRMSKPNAKGLTNLRHKLKKYCADFETELREYKESPDPEGYTSREEEEAAADEDSADDSDASSEAPLAKPKKTRKSYGSDSDDWGDSDSSSSDSELEDLEGKKMEDLRKMFLKKEETDKDKERKEERKAAKRAKQEAKERERMEEEPGWEPVRPGGKAVERPKMFEKDAEITVEAAQKKLGEILQVRGKKGTDRHEMVELLRELKGIVEGVNLGPPISLKILFSIISGLFEYNPKLSECMKTEVWQSALKAIQELLGMLKEKPELCPVSDLPEERENLDKPEEDGRFYLSGSVVGVVERLDDEFMKILQVADCHSTDYVEKLKGEGGVVEAISEVEKWLETQGPGVDPAEMCRIKMKAIEHLYYKLERTDPKKVEEDMGQRCQYVYAKDGTRRLRERAILMQIYHHALHDRYQQARDLLLMSHLQISIELSDIPNQILYNRALCQLGLSAFRDGKIGQAHAALSDMQNSGRGKELLAQGLSIRPTVERTAEQEKLERQRQIPYHMHINLELMECVYLISSMLLEIPPMAGRETESRRRHLSRSFHYQLKQSERSSLPGPPENTREHVVAASKALLCGDAKAAIAFLINDKMNAKVWNLFPNPGRVREMLTLRVQEEALRAYLLAHASVYNTVSLNVLSSIFSLTPGQIHSLVSKMILNEELMGSLDEPAECLVMHRVEPSRLQLLSLQLTDKLAQMAENNDGILDPKPQQPFSQRGPQQQGSRDGGWAGGNRNMRGGRGGGGYRNNRNSNYQGRNPRSHYNRY